MRNIIKLKGKTSKGKNRIREHGELWNQITLDEIGLVSSRNPHLIDRSIQPIRSHLTGEWRWFDFHIDKDFEIITK